VLLCEDAEHRRLAIEYMKLCGINTRYDVDPMVASERQKGNAKQWVINEFPRQLHACRQRSAKAKTLLIVFVDADTDSVHKRKQELIEAVKAAGLEQLRSADPVIYLVPKWHVETWIKSLRGERITEDEPCKEWRGISDSELKAAVTTLYA